MSQASDCLYRDWTAELFEHLLQSEQLDGAGGIGQMAIETALEVTGSDEEDHDARLEAFFEGWARRYLGQGRP